jgi:prepilin-type N-terminal cleavage/methylation domain-containing protein
MLTRRGLTLIELIVAMTVGGVALALIAVISVRQQRLYADVADRTALTGQLRQASAVLPIELRAASPGAGDIREARDTAIELRSSIATAVVCDTLGGSIVLAPASPGAAAFAGYLTAIASGDTAWVLARGDTADAWIPYPVSSVSSVAPGPCGPLGPRLNPTALVSRRVAIGLGTSGPIANVAGSVLRVTRPVRYSLYRGGDGRWYLGQRDWNVASMRFNTIQPVSGPFSSASSHGLVFQYVDSTGAALPIPVSDSRAISLIRIDLRGQSRNVMRAFAGQTQGKSTDSVRLAVWLRNRR